MYLFSCVERERKYILSFYVYIYTCTYFHVFGSKVFLIRFQSLYLIIVYPYEILLYLIGFSNSICVITCTYVMYHNNSIYVLS